MQKEMAYDEFVRFVFSQGPVQVTQAQYYDIALPDIDDASVLVNTQFKIASAKGIKVLIDHFKKQLVKPGEGDNTVMVDPRVNYIDRIGDLLKEILQPSRSASNSDVAQLLVAADTEISPVS